MLVQSIQGSPQSAHVVVLGNEKGGSGKSTTAMHVIVGLLHEGRRIGCLDLDVRQATLSRYLANRAEFCRRGGVCPLRTAQVCRLNQTPPGPSQL